MRYRVAAGVGYAALMLFWVYGVLDQGLDVPEAAAWIVLVAAQIAAGAVVGWWALLLPPALILAAIPAGYRDAPVGEELPIWVGVFILAGPALVLMALGAIGGIVLERRMGTP